MVWMEDYLQMTCAGLLGLTTMMMTVLFDLSRLIGCSTILLLIDIDDGRCVRRMLACNCNTFSCIVLSWVEIWEGRTWWRLFSRSSWSFSVSPFFGKKRTQTRSQIKWMLSDYVRYAICSKERPHRCNYYATDIPRPLHTRVIFRPTLDSLLLFTLESLYLVHHHSLPVPCPTWTADKQ